MKYSSNIIAFKSHVKSAMNDEIAWNMVDLMLDNLCTNFEISKQVIQMLLEELKSYKITNTCYSNQKYSLRGPASPGHQLAVYWLSWYKMYLKHCW